MTDAVHATEPHDAHKLAEAKKATAAAAFGTFLEYYDFSVYGYCAARMSAEFFPSDNPTVSLLSTLAVFGLAFIVRPLGGLFFGRIGDRYGRKVSLLATVILIGLACTAIGCLPVYSEIGSAASYIREWAPPSRQALYLSFVPSVANFGKAAAAGLAGLTAYLFAGEQASWAWRVPFLMALPLMLGCLYLRLKIEDTPDFKQMKASGKLSKAPVRELLSAYPASLAKLFMFSLVQNVGTYCGTVYVAIYLRTVLKMPAAEVGFIVLIAVTCAALFIPVFGIMTDRIGATKTLVGCYVCYIVLSYPCYALMGGSFSMTVLALVVTMIPYALCQAGSYSMYPELLPPKVRSTGVSFGHSMGAVLGGATTPFLATWLISAFNDIMIPTYILMFTGAIGLLNLMCLKKADPAEGRRFR